jgi:hypothetical protein
MVCRQVGPRPNILPICQLGTNLAASLRLSSERGERYERNVRKHGEIYEEEKVDGECREIQDDGV